MTGSWCEDKSFFESDRQGPILIHQRVMHARLLARLSRERPKAPSRPPPSVAGDELHVAKHHGHTRLPEWWHVHGKGKREKAHYLLGCRQVFNRYTTTYEQPKTYKKTLHKNQHVPTQRLPLPVQNELNRILNSWSRRQKQPSNFPNTCWEFDSVPVLFCK